MLIDIYMLIYLSGDPQDMSTVSFCAWAGIPGHCIAFMPYVLNFCKHQVFSLELAKLRTREAEAGFCLFCL